MAHTKEYAYTFSDFSIGQDTIAELMGYGTALPAPDPIVDIIGEVLQEVPALCGTRGGYVITEPIIIDKKSKSVRAGNLEFHTGNIVTHQLQNSEAAAWFVCTAGRALSDYTQRLMKDGDLLKGYTVDVVANITVDLAMDEIQEALKEEVADKGWQITNRYSPGYCEWDITEQKKLFSLLPDGFMGVSLTESSLMQPIKSVSGIIGLGAEVSFNEYTCNLCNMNNCMYRNMHAVRRNPDMKNLLN